MTARGRAVSSHRTTAIYILEVAWADTSAISPRGEGFGALADVALSMVDLTAAPGHALVICATGSKLTGARSQWADFLK